MVDESELERELHEVGRRLWKGLPSSARRPLKALDDKAMALASSDAELKAALHDRLALVVAEHFTFEHWVDDDMRQIPDHYHAHARPVGGFFGHAGLRRPAPVDGGGPDAGGTT